MRHLLLFLALVTALTAAPVPFSFWRTAAPGGPAYTAAILADTPLAYWRMNEAAGSSTLADSSGNGYTLTVPGSGWSVGSLAGVDDSGKSISSAGTAAFLGGSTLAAALMDSAPWTVELWVYRVGNGRIFSASNGSGKSMSIEVYAGLLYTNSDAFGGRSSADYLHNGWNHIVLTSSGGLYLNGVSQTGASNTSMSTTVNVALAGRNDSSNLLSCYLTNVALYKSVLSAGTVTNHYNLGRASTLGTDRLFYWTVESDSADAAQNGMDFVAQYDLGAARSTAQAYAGSYSLALGGSDWRSATFDNPGNQPRIAKIDVGTARMRFRYTGTTGGVLLIIGGKDRSNVNDTDDAIRVSFNPTSCTVDYYYANAASTTTATVSTTISADAWHLLEVKWNTAGSPTLSVSVDGTAATTTTSIGSVTCSAWHHLLIGNDSVTIPTGLWIDDVEIFGSWL